MIAGLPLWVTVLFIGCVVFSIWYFHLLVGSKKLFLFIIAYAIIQSTLAFSGFYLNATTIPPRAVFVLFPVVIMLIYGLTGSRLKQVIQAVDIKRGTLVHSIRMPVEVVLHQLFLVRMVPQLMTFEGRNFDILIGVSAPIVGLLYAKGKVGNRLMLVWNWVGLAFVLWIVANAVLSIETPFQQFAFDQPNRGVLYIPFILLPAVIVPIVVYMHIVTVIKLNQAIKK